MALVRHDRTSTKADKACMIFRMVSEREWWYKQRFICFSVPSHIASVMDLKYFFFKICGHQCLSRTLNIFFNQMNHVLDNSAAYFMMFNSAQGDNGKT